MGSNKETLKKEIVAACSQFTKHNRKDRRVSNTRKRKFWVKPWLPDFFLVQFYFFIFCACFFVIK